RIVRLHDDAARVGQRPFRRDADRGPRLAAVVAPEELAVGAGEDAWTRRPRDRHVVHVGIVETVHDAPPAVAAVIAPENAVDLDTGPQRPRTIRVDDEARDERLTDRALRGRAEREFLPALAAIARPIEAGGPRPRVDGTRVDRIDR